MTILSGSTSEITDMKLTVKTLKGGKFDIQVEDTQTVADVKSVIETTKAELPAASTKLIHSGKVLKDEDVISSCGIKESDFLVVMLTKPKKLQTPSESVPAPSSVPTPAPPETPVAATNPGTSSSDVSMATPAAATTSTTPPAPARNTTDTFSDETVNNLTVMGFPEAEVRHCLRAANGNPDVAVEFLTNGIPEGVTEAVHATRSSAQTPNSTSAGAPLQALRNHPQFDALRRLVQSNPAMLQQVLTQIGQQQPELLQEINANQALFLQMMNEPVSESGAPEANASQPSVAPTESSPRLGGGIGDIGGSPVQMAQLIQSMGPEELNQMAAMMGIPSEQLNQMAMMIGRMPPEQLNQFMMQAMGGGEGMMGGSHVLRLTEEEMAAVDRLAEMGFDRSEAAQAFIACDRNEALAANFLMDSMADGGFGGGDYGDGNDNDNGNEDDDNMYD